MHLTKEWAHTFLPLRIRVNCVAPGVFPPILPGEGVRDEGQRARLERVGHEIPAGNVSLDLPECDGDDDDGCLIWELFRSAREGV
jgi:NAD(P)-dependent dehydrogenase (short-subunit alcohol dehydrogenase family)